MFLTLSNVVICENATIPVAILLFSSHWYKEINRAGQRKLRRITALDPGWPGFVLFPDLVINNDDAKYVMSFTLMPVAFHHCLNDEEAFDEMKVGFILIAQGVAQFSAGRPGLMIRISSFYSTALRGGRKR